MSINNCYKQVSILRGRTSEFFFAKAVTCGSFICDHCREQIVEFEILTMFFHRYVTEEAIKVLLYL